MSTSNIGDPRKRFNDMNRDIESLLLNIYDDNGKKVLLSEITKEIRISVSKKLLKCFLIIAFVITQMYVIPCLNWNASAIGRIIMIRLLKVWDWRYLYNVDCLIERKVEVKFEFSQNTFDNTEVDCSFCENIEEIHHEWDLSYSEMKSNYINRGQPVIIEEHEFSSQHSNLYEYIENLKNLTNLMNSSPCNLMTNLMTGSHFKSLAVLLQLTKESSDGWFLHFRNCDFDAVKSSRALEQPPYFLSSHLKPFSSSWIVMSDRYKVKKPKKLWLNNLVVVKQIIGGIDALIVPKTGCEDICKDYLIQLDVGYTIVFSAEHWEFLYMPSSQEDSVTFIREYELNI